MRSFLRLALSAYLVSALALATPASAYWGSAGGGTGHGSTGTLAPPTAVIVPTYNLSAVSVPVSWTASGGLLSPEGYFVTRSTGGVPVAACGSSAAALITGTSCADASVPDGTYTYTVTAKYRSWTAPAVDDSTVTVLTPTKVAFTAQPTNATAGAAIAPGVEVTVQTAADAAVPLAGRSVTVALTTPAGATLSGTATATTNSSGVAVFSGLSVDKADSYTLTATSSGLTSGTSSSFTVSAGTSAAFAFTSSPLNATAVASPTLGPITVRSQDAVGNATLAGAGGTVVNLSSNSTGTKSFAATSGGAPITSVTILAGTSTASFFYGDNKSGAPVITASGALTTSTQTQTISAGAVTKLAVAPASTSLTAGVTSGTITVTRQDTYGNPVVTGSATGVALTKSSGTGVVSPASPLSIAGHASSTTFTYADNKTGNWTVGAAASGLTGASLAVEVVPAAASKFLLTPTSTTAVAWATPNLGTITVQRLDAFDNPVTTGTTTLALSSGSGGASFSPSTSPAISAGSSTTTFNYGDTVKGTPTITVAATGFTPKTQLVTINPGTATKLAFSAPIANTGQGSGSTIPVAVLVQDQFGNTANSTVTVAVAIGNNAGLLGLGVLNGDKTKTAAAGVATFTDLNITSALGLHLAAGTGYTLVATSGSLTGATSNAFSVS